MERWLFPVRGRRKRMGLLELSMEITQSQRCLAEKKQWLLTTA